MKRKERDHNEDDEKDKNLSKLDPIPLDIEMEILTRLPVMSLMKFQCVSKMWSSIIRSQIFVNSFFAISSRMRSRFIIAVSPYESAKPEEKRLFIFSAEEKESSTLVTNLDMTIPLESLTSASKCASVDGFIGCTNKNGPYIVCNPSTGKFTMLGYDPVNDQFKALTLITYPLTSHDDCSVHEVLTLGKNGLCINGELERIKCLGAVMDS